MEIGFTLAASSDRPARLSLSSPPSGRSDRHPLIDLARDSRDSSIAVLLGRLFYRDDALARLPQTEHRQYLSDAELVLAVYRHDGKAGLERLEGEFALALWDGRARRLIGLRDPFGGWPLFWFAHGESVALGTSLAALGRHLPGLALNQEYVAEFLMRPYGADELPEEATAWDPVRRVMPGGSVELRPGLPPRRGRQWDWAERIEPYPEASSETAAVGFAERFRAAVGERLGQGRTAAHLSGGMDSSAVVCVAADLLDGDRLAALSLVYDHPTLGGERKYVDQVLRRCPSVEPFLLDADKALDFDWFDKELPFHDEPYPALGCLARERLLADAAEQADVAMVLTGFGSDEMLECPPHHLADLLRQGRLTAAVAEAAAWARSWDCGWWTVLRAYGVDPLVPVLGREGFGPFLRSGYGRWPSLGWFTVPPWIKPGFARAVGLRDRGRAHARRMTARPAARSADRNMLDSTAGDWCRWHLTAPRGINSSHPFRDPRLVAYTLGLPPAVRSTMGRSKALLRDALHDVLPPAVRDRRGKRGFDEIYGRGLSRHLPELERLVRNSSLRDLELFDSTELIAAMRSAAVGVGDVRACERLDKTLALIAWYERAQRGEPSPQTLVADQLAEARQIVGGTPCLR